MGHQVTCGLVCSLVFFCFCFSFSLVLLEEKWYIGKLDLTEEPLQFSLYFENILAAVCITEVAKSESTKEAILPCPGA